MFCVIYEYDVIQGKENDFKRLRHEIAIDVKELAGSRLHKIMNKENTWVTLCAMAIQRNLVGSGSFSIKNKPC